MSGTPDARRERSRSRVSLFAQGEPMLWLTGGGLAVALAMIAGLLLLVLVKGVTTLWPMPLEQFAQRDGTTLMGEVTREEQYAPEDNSTEKTARRRLLRTGNFDLTGEHFQWVADSEIQEASRPEWGAVVERTSWGRFYGVPSAFLLSGKVVSEKPEEIWALYNQHHGHVRARAAERRDLETHEVGRINRKLENSRLALRKVERRYGDSSPEYAAAQGECEAVGDSMREDYDRIRKAIDEINTENAAYQVRLRTADGTEQLLNLADIVRAYPANRLTLAGKVRVYFSRWVEFLTAPPREANSEGGVFPAIFGTVVMTLLMSLAVVPLGVMAALYLREYAKGGAIVSAVRISINNLAGVPSIVFGVFGLGFFCYLMGAGMDQWLFSAALPNPTFGKGGILWASLTLALLTLPVVIVATEEALSAVPNSMREGSYACGAGKWQTIKRIVLPRAMPGIMTGMILAMARGAGEVAPLMLVGAVKLAPELPVDGVAPFLHAQRSFMHLGFHIYDLGFQSQNSEAAKPMVFTTTLLLIALIFVLNIVAVRLRTRLRRKFVTGAF
ncbi:MAG: phosphate ABC transporter permease PstA [Kiritimatiellae bacterium]|nr:phosphate ABC transporter permease PstA [Kiritimatiellia bacterium]